MFVFNESARPTPCELGVTRRVLAFNDQLMLCEITFAKGAKGNVHAHPHTQATYVVKGSFAFTVDGETKIVRAGDTVLMPSGAKHGCECLEDGVLCDVFTPMRQDFIKP